MTFLKVGALVIGQSPRPDLFDPLATLLPSAHIIQVGALDGLTAADLPPVSGHYPLVTRLRSGEQVQIEESFVEPLLQQAIHQLEAQNVDAIILLCAGTFASLHSKLPLVKPFAAGQQVLQKHKGKSIGFIAPIEGQERPIYDRWMAAGVPPVVWTADVTNQDEIFEKRLKKKMKQYKLDCIVLDYVGHSAENIQSLQTLSPVPIYDLGQVAMNKLASLV